MTNRRIQFSKFCQTHTKYSEEKSCENVLQVAISCFNLSVWIDFARFSDFNLNLRMCKTHAKENPRNI